MSLDNLTKEELIKIIKSNADVIDLDKILERFIPEKDRDIVTTLHTLYCKLPHQPIEGKIHCSFYEEIDWTDKCKSLWLSYIGKILSEVNCKYKSDIKTSDISKILQELTEVEDIKKEIEKDEGKAMLDIFLHLITL